MKNATQCCVESCSLPVHAKGMCKSHYQKVLYRQKNNLSRTTNDANEIYTENGIAYIKLYNRRGIHIATATVDEKDVKNIEGIKWRRDYKRKYVVATYNNGIKESVIYLHRFITDVPKDMEIDHIDGNPLNNCRSNLRFCTSQQNKFNKKFFRDNTTPGVTRCGSSYRARIVLTVNNKKLDKSKFFKCKEDAINQRLAWEREYYGEFSAHAKLIDGSPIG